MAMHANMPVWSACVRQEECLLFLKIHVKRLYPDKQK
jgi:hypothetical protein